MEVQRECTTPAELQEKLANNSNFLTIYFSGESDVAGLIECIQKHGGDASEKIGWTVEWCGGRGSQLENCSELVDLLQAIGKHAKAFESLKLRLPFKAGDMATVSKSLAFLNEKGITLVALEQQGPQIDSAAEPQIDSAAEDLIDVMAEACGWEGLEILILKPNLYPDPIFFKRLNHILPKLPGSLNRLFIDFQSKNPPNDDKFQGPDFIKQLKNSLSQIQKEGLENNCSLCRLEFSTHDSLLKETMGGGLLGENNFLTLLYLNYLGRKHVISMPLHLDTWLQVVSQYSGDLHATYYYLRRNTWMFHPDKGETKSLEVQAAMAEYRKRHEEEMENKNTEIKDLREQLKSQKAESEEKGWMIKCLAILGLSLLWGSRVTKHTS